MLVCSVTVDAFGCPDFQVFPQTWTDPQQSLSKPWNDETMWLHPPEHLWSGVAVKTVMKVCRGSAIIPVVKEASWWSLIGEFAVDWVKTPTGHPLVVTSHGKVKNCTIQYRDVFFDSFGHHRVQQPGPSQPAIRLEAVCNGRSEPSIHSQSHGLPDSQPRAEGEPASEPVSAPSSQFVLSDAGLCRQRWRFGS